MMTRSTSAPARPLASLAHLVQGGDLDSFFRRTWARDTHLCPGALAGAVDQLLTLEAFEELIATLPRAAEGWLHLARGGVKAIPQGMVDADGMLDLGRIRAAFADGETLYLTKAERLSPPVAHLCRTVELDLRARGVGLRQPVNAHVFLTPPDSQGFPVHRDEHGSFILQLEGTKAWTVHEPAAGPPPDRPLRTGAVSKAALAGTRAHRHELRAGDVLYMPEWWPHEAHATHSHSLHLTLRVFPLRWVDLVLALGPEHPALARTVPAGAEVAELAGPLLELLASQAFVGPLAGLLGDLDRARAVPQRPLPRDGLRQLLGLDRIQEDTPLVRCEGVTCAVFTVGDEVSLVFPGGVIQGPALIRPVFEHLARAVSLRARDLPPIPGGTYDCLSIVRRMVRDGVLRAAGEVEG